MGAAAAVAGIGAATSLAGGLMSSGTVSGAQKAANDAQLKMYEQTRNDLAPFRDAGTAAVGATGDILGLNGPDAQTTAFGRFRTDPGYQFQFDQGLRAVDAGAAARGMARSGATIKAEEAFGQGLADQSFSNYYNRLFGLATLGANSAAQTGTAATQTGQGIAQTDASAGALQASIYSNLAKGFGSQINTLFNSPNFSGGGMFTAGPASPAQYAAFNTYGPV